MGDRLEGVGTRILLLVLISLGAWGCTDTGAVQANGDGGAGRPSLITSEAEFDRILATAGDRILVIDFYADWCAPCKILAPILAEVAAETEKVAVFYAVDVDQSRDLARRMGVSGIPNVLLIKKGKILENLRGVLPKKTYLAAIRKLPPPTAP
jgi:thioredoxin 1